MDVRWSALAMPALQMMLKFGRFCSHRKYCSNF